MSSLGWTHTSYAQRVHFGGGAADRIGEIVKESGARRVLLVMSAGRAGTDEANRIARRLGRSLAVTFDDARTHVPMAGVQQALALAQREGIDGIVSFGGGSTIDLGKAIAWFLEQQQGTPGVSYLDRPILPHVAIATTYSGAEMTPVFAVTDERTRTTAGQGSATTAPVAVVHDPLLTLDLPVRASAETAFTALAHAVEIACATNRSPEGEALALEAIRRIVAALPDVVDDPGEVEARADLLVGAGLAGRSLVGGWSSLHHVLASLVAGRSGIAHGLVSAVLLPPVLRFNGDVLPDRTIARIGEAMGDPDDPSGAIARLLERCGLPERLGAAQLTDDDVDAVVRMAASHPQTGRNPRPVGAADVAALLEEVR